MNGMKKMEFVEKFQDVLHLLKRYPAIHSPVILRDYRKENMKYIVGKERKTPVMSETDVVAVGAGASLRQ